MKSITFDHLKTQPSTKGPRNQKEDLIEQIVAQCTLKPGDDRKLARVLAIAANTGKWTTTDLHALLKKKNDPALRNFTAFVWWSAKVKKAEA